MGAAEPCLSGMSWSCSRSRGRRRRSCSSSSSSSSSSRNISICVVPCVMRFNRPVARTSSQHSPLHATHNTQRNNKHHEPPTTRRKKERQRQNSPSTRIALPTPSRHPPLDGTRTTSREMLIKQHPIPICFLRIRDIAPPFRARLFQQFIANMNFGLRLECIDPSVSDTV